MDDDDTASPQTNVNSGLNDAEFEDVYIKEILKEIEEELETMKMSTLNKN